MIIIVLVGQCHQEVYKDAYSVKCIVLFFFFLFFFLM